LRSDLRLSSIPLPPASLFDPEKGGNALGFRLKQRQLPRTTDG
jgi:hypothetical protein